MGVEIAGRPHAWMPTTGECWRRPHTRNAARTVERDRYLPNGSPGRMVDEEADLESNTIG